MNFSETHIKKLCEHPLFCGLDEKRLHSLLSQNGCEVREIDAKEVLLSPKSTEKFVGLILSGKAAVTTPDPTKSVLLRYLGAGDLFGIANLFTKGDYVSIIRASSDCRVFFLTESAIRALIESETTFLYRYLEFLSGRICFLNRKIGYLTAGNAERRLALYLHSLEKNPVTLPLSLSALSELLDIGRASLYRAFDRLEADGLIQKDGKTIHLLDPDALLRAYQS